MRLHTNTVTSADLDAAVRAAGLRADNLTATEHGSRTHARAWNVYLTGSSSRDTNTRSGTPAHAGKAATFDEWGMFLAALYAVDPNMRAGGSATNPVYGDAEHFRWVTSGRYGALTPADQHRNHRWGMGRRSASGNYWTRECDGCEAVIRTATYAAFRAYVAAGV